MIDLPPDPPSLVVPADATNVPVMRTPAFPRTPGRPEWPDDPLFPAQWALRMVHAPSAWRLADELSAAGIASPAPRPIGIIDTAMIPPDSYVGELDIAETWNTVFGNPVHLFVPVCVHATHVASIAGARTNNALGMAGVAWNLPILAVQVLHGCYGNQVDCAEGILWAVDHGASVVSLSLQYGATPEPAMTAACQYAADLDVFVVAAAGNYYWPAALAVPAMLPTVVGVGAVTEEGKHAHFSNAGDDLELCAPGQDVLGLTMAGFELWAGTSMATPHVAGAAWLIRTLFPSLSAAEVRLILNSTADDIGPPGRDPQFGFGVVNVYRALHAAVPCAADFDRDGSLTAADFGAFQSAFVDGRYRADCNGDEAWTVADFGCFQMKFVEGCR